MKSQVAQRRSATRTARSNATQGTEEPALPGLWCRPPPAEGEREGEAAKRRRGCLLVSRGVPQCFTMMCRAQL